MRKFIKIACLLVLLGCYLSIPGCWLHRVGDSEAVPAAGAIKVSAVASAGSGTFASASMKGAVSPELRSETARKFSARIKIGAARPRMFSLDLSEDLKNLRLDAVVDALGAGKQQLTIEIVASEAVNADPVLKTIATATVAVGQTNENDIKNAPIDFNTTAKAISYESWGENSTRSIDDFNPAPASITALAATIESALGTSIDGSKTLADPVIQAEADRVAETTAAVPAVPALTLVAISLNPVSASVVPNAVFNLADVVITATYSDNSTKTVSGIWSIKSGGGTLSELSFTAPAADGQSVLGCNYQEGEINAAADFTIAVITPAGSGTLTGTIKDAVTQSPLAGAAIKVYDVANNLSANVVSDSGGNYSISLTAQSGYRVEFSKDGYLPATYENVTIEANINKILENIMQIDLQHAGAGNASGIITDATTGSGVDSANMSLRKGINAVSGTIEATTTTGSSGNYQITGLEAGLYTAEVVKTGYITGHFSITVIGGQTTGNQNTSISPSLLTGAGFRVQVTWGATPSDVDSYLTGPTPDGGRFDVHMGGDYYFQSEMLVEHDVDDTYMYGPETITVIRQLEGVYRYTVRNFSMNSINGLAESGAKVTLYQGDAIKAIFNVPNSPGYWWTVFELNGTTLTPVNVMYDNRGDQLLSYK